MAERDSIDQLNQALEARSGDGAMSLDRSVRELLAIVRDVRDMPRDAFRSRLKNELLKETTQMTATAPAANYIREGFHSITPYLVVQGASQLIDFMAQAFGAEEKARYLTPAGTIMHAEVRIGDSVVELGDGNEQHPARPSSIHLLVEDVDATYQRAIAAGATSTGVPTDHPYGERGAGVTDRAGNHWYLGRSLTGPYIPEGLRNVNAYLHPIGADKLIDFLKRGLGAEEVAVYREPADGPVVHAKIRIGDSIVEMGEAHGPYQPMPMGLHLYVEDTDATYQRALAAGAKSVRPPEDAPYGDRTAGVEDPAGNTWWLATPLAK